MSEIPDVSAEGWLEPYVVRPVSGAVPELIAQVRKGRMSKVVPQPVNERRVEVVPSRRATG